MVPACKGETFFLIAWFQREGSYSLVMDTENSGLACDFRKRGNLQTTAAKQNPVIEPARHEKPVIAYPL